MKSTYKLIFSALMLAFGIVLPFLTGQIPQIGKLLLPMHIPVFLCAFICGWHYAAVIGFTLPLLRSAMFGAPVLYPNAIGMAVELFTYGAVTGLIYKTLKKKNVLSVYASMVPAMFIGRAVWGAVRLLLYGVNQTPFTWSMFMAGAFIDALPGIILQLILIPIIILTVNAKEISK